MDGWMDGSITTTTTSSSSSSSSFFFFFDPVPLHLPFLSRLILPSASNLTPVFVPNLVIRTSNLPPLSSRQSILYLLPMLGPIDIACGDTHCRREIVTSSNWMWERSHRPTCPCAHRSLRLQSSNPDLEVWKREPKGRSMEEQ